MTPERESSLAFDLATLSDVGSERANNEDCSGSWVDGAKSALLAVADGVGGYEGGELPSPTAIDVTLKAYTESPASWGAPQPLHRAAPQTNIQIYDPATVVPELP